MISSHTSSTLKVETRIDPQEALHHAIEEQWRDLLTMIRLHVWKFGLAADREEVEGIANEVLQETIATALDRAAVFDPNRSALAWLRGIALNEIRTVKRARYMDHKRTIAVADTPQVRQAQRRTDTYLTEDEMYDVLMDSGRPNERPQATLDDLLGLVDERDRQTLMLAFGEGLPREELAAVLGISLGAVWSRVSRAVTRLSHAYLQSERMPGEGK